MRLRAFAIGLASITLVACGSSKTEPLAYGLSVAVTGPGTVSSSPAGISCGGTCDASFPQGTSVTLTATPGSGAAFQGWGGACSGASATCTVALSAAANVTATFVAVHALSVSVSGDGNVSDGAQLDCSTGNTGTCGETVADGASVTFTATPLHGEVFQGWTGDAPASCGLNPSCTISVSADATLVANFGPVHSVNVTINGPGTVGDGAGLSCSSGTCSATYWEGTTVTLTATATGGALFNGWSGASAGLCFGATCSLDITSDVDLTANFGPPEHLTVSLAGGGVGQVSEGAQISCTGGASGCTATYGQGQGVTLVATASAGHSTFSGWTGVAGCSTDPTCTFTLAADTTVTANFAPVPHDFTVTSSGFGTGVTLSSPDLDCSSGTGCTGTIPDGQSATITATHGASVSATWQVGCASVSDSPTNEICTSPPVTADRSGALVRFNQEVSGLTATPNLQTAHLGWTPLSDPSSVSEIDIYAQGPTDEVPQRIATALPTDSSIDLTNKLIPGADYTYLVTSLDTQGYESQGVRVTVKGQSVSSAHGALFGFTWDAANFYATVGKPDGSNLLIHPNDTLWIAIDTDDTGNATLGQTATTIVGNNTVFWPFGADKLIELKLDGSLQPAATLYDLSASTATSLAAAPLHQVNDGTHKGFDEVIVSKSELGSPSAMRFAFFAFNAGTGWGYDLSPTDFQATEVTGYHSSLTASLNPYVHVFQAAYAASSADSSVTLVNEAPWLVTFTVDMTGALPIAGHSLQISSDTPPFESTAGNALYTLVDDGFHLDGAAGDGVYGGRFNLNRKNSHLCSSGQDCAGGYLYFHFVDYDPSENLFTDEPGFGSVATGTSDPRRDRIYGTDGQPDNLPTVVWGTAWDASHSVDLQIFVATGGTPTNITGSAGELGNWCDNGAGASDSPVLSDYRGTDPSDGSEIYGTGPITFTNRDFGANPIAFKTLYSNGCNYEGGSDHHFDDDVLIPSQTLPFPLYFHAGSSTDF
jgi:hypothetical protein